MGAVMNKLIVAAMAAFSLVTLRFAYAADLAPEPAYKVPVVPAVPVYNWTGIYFGVNGGYAFGQATPMSLYSSDFSAFNFNTNGWLAGVTAGAQI